MAEQKDLNPKTYDLINVILGCDIITTFNDKLVGTKAYRQKLKVHSKGLGEEVDKVLDTELARMYSIDEEIYQNISINMERFVKNMSKNIVDMRPDDFLELNQIIELYCNNKQEFQDSFEITMRKLNEK
jgi:hypothetical protein